MRQPRPLQSETLLTDIFTNSEEKTLDNIQLQNAAFHNVFYDQYIIEEQKPSFGHSNLEQSDNGLSKSVV